MLTSPGQRHCQDMRDSLWARVGEVLSTAVGEGPEKIGHFAWCDYMERDSSDGLTLRAEAVMYEGVLKQHRVSSALVAKSRSNGTV